MVEDIWDTVTAETESIQLTKEEKEVIDKRLDAYYENPNLGSPWENVYKKIINK